MNTSANDRDSHKDNGFPWIDPEEMPKWLLLMRVYLQAKQCYISLEKEIPTMDEDTFIRLLDAEGEETDESRAYRAKYKKKSKKWREKDALAVAYLIRACTYNPTAMTLVQDNPEISARELVDLLTKRFHLGDLTGVVQTKLAEFNTLTLDTGESIEGFTTRLLRKRMELNGLGCEYITNDLFCLGRLKEALLQDTRFHELALSLKTIPDLLWDRAIHLCVGYEKSMAPDESRKRNRDTSGSGTTVDETVRRLKVKFNKKIKTLESKFNNKKSDSKGDYNNKTCAKCGKKGHLARNCTFKGPDKRTCYGCGKTGHIKSNCPAENGGAKAKNPPQHFDDDFSDTCNMLSERSGLQTKGVSKINMDSGATSHMVPQSIADAVQDQELVAQRRSVETAKRGVSFTTTHRGRLGKMKDTLVTEEGILSEAVASVARFDLNGQYVLFGGGRARVLDKNFNVEAEAPLGKDLAYRFDIDDLTGEKVLLGSARPTEDLELWHQRLAHRNKKDLGTAIRQRHITGPSQSAGRYTKDMKALCDPCSRAKSTRRSMSRARENSSSSKVTTIPKVLKPVDKVVEEIVTDLKGPFSVPGLKGELYMQLYTDSRTKWRECKCMQFKAGAFNNTKELVEVDLAREGQTLLQLHSDGAPELISKETVLYCANKGIKVSYSPAYTPEKNGLAERSNRTIWESAFTMWTASSLPACFWVDAVQYAVVCANGLPTNTALGWTTPFQAKYGCAYDVSRHRIWGCIVYVHVPSEVRDSTFADKAYKGFHIGFAGPSNDRYKVFVPSLDKVIESIHCNFDEVTKVFRAVDEVITVAAERKEPKDFAFLTSMAYKDDENNVLYVTTRVTTSRGFVVCYRAPVVLGRLGKEEPTPVHAQDVERMLKEYWHTSTPVMWSDNKLINVCSIMPQATQKERSEQSDQLPEIPDTAGVAPLDSGSLGAGAGQPRDTPARESGQTPEEGRPVESVPGTVDSVPDRRSRRDRAQRKPLNVGQLGSIAERASIAAVKSVVTGGEISERSAYLAVEALIDETDDAAECWQEPKVKELASHVLEHKSYEVVDLPPGRKPITAKWVVKEKTQPTRKLKARFTPRGCGQMSGIDYKETFAPVAKLTTLRVFLTLVALLSLTTSQLDMKTAFLNAFLEEEIYCRPLHDHVSILILLFKTLTDGEQRARVADQIRRLRRGQVLLLKRAIYGLKQAPREWWKKLHAYLKSIGFVPNPYDVCFYVMLLPGGVVVLLLLYVDDIILAGTTQKVVDHYASMIGKMFRVGEEGPLTTYLGFDIKVNPEQRTVSLCMEKYVQKCFKRFNLLPKKTVQTPLAEGIQNVLEEAPLADQEFCEDFLYREKIGCLLYYMICMRYDICFAVGLMAKYSNKVSRAAAAGVTQMWQYCFNTASECLVLGGNGAYITAFSDSDWAGDKLTRKSIGSWVMFLGKGPVDWGSKQQRLQAQSSAEAEFIAMTAPAKAIMWLRWMLHQTRIESIVTQFSSTLFVDNTAAIAIASNPVHSDRTKHVALKYKLIRELEEVGVITCEHITSLRNIADIGTKALGKVKFSALAGAALGQEEFQRPTKRRRTEQSDEFV